MNVETIANIVKASKNFGVTKVKFSGGEPLMRDDFEEIIKALPELRDISVTTNGTTFSKRAHDLAACGLDRVNISLPSLDSETYRKITGGDINVVFDGIDAAVSAGLLPVKLNMVLMDGLNIDEIQRMMEFAGCYRGKVILQLIELMSFQETEQYRVNIDKVEEQLKKKASNIIERSMHRRKKYHIDGVEVELVRPIDNSHFCSNCTRLRVTSDGKLKPCLLRNDNLVDANNKDPHEIEQLLKLVMDKREPFYKNRS